jgi:hypothetical protein
MLLLLLSGRHLHAQAIPAVVGALGASHGGPALSHPLMEPVTALPSIPPRDSVRPASVDDRQVASFAIRAHPAGVSAAATDTAADDATEAQPAHHHHILLGMAIGTVAGAGIGYLWVRTICHNNNSEAPPCEFGARVSAVYGALAGWLVGGIIGAYAERRVPGHPGRHVSMGMIPQRGRGMAVTVRIH